MDAVTDFAEIERELEILADPERARALQRFFKTGPGQYGEGDRFLGIRVPELRTLVRRARTLPLDAGVALLRSPWHEKRLLALLLLVDRYRRGDTGQRDEIHGVYLANTRYLNSWDLVDSSAEHIVGAHLIPSRTDLLEDLARSESVWERRIAMLATFHWIKQMEFRPALRVATLLVQDRHDLIQKAVGWMLREIGKRDRATEEQFLLVHYRHMPRTMLRYSLEHFPAERRTSYLRGEVG